MWRKMNTAQKVERIKSVWWDGISASGIAQLVGTTRGAIVSVYFRVKNTDALAEHPLNKRSFETPRKSRQRKPRIKQTAPLHETYDEATEINQESWSPIPITTRDVPLVDLQASDCRWVVTVYPPTYCGHLRREGSSFCPHHHRIVYIPAPTRSGKHDGPKSRASNGRHRVI